MRQNSMTPGFACLASLIPALVQAHPGHAGHGELPTVVVNAHAIADRPFGLLVAAVLAGCALSFGIGMLIRHAPDWSRAWLQRRRT
jgi:hypothetical protein